MLDVLDPRAAVALRPWHTPVIHAASASDSDGNSALFRPRGCCVVEERASGRLGTLVLAVPVVLQTAALATPRPGACPRPNPRGPHVTAKPKSFCLALFRCGGYPARR